LQINRACFRGGKASANFREKVEQEVEQEAPCHELDVVTMRKFDDEDEYRPT